MRVILIILNLIFITNTSVAVEIGVRAMGHIFAAYNGQHIITENSIPASEYETPYSPFEADESYSFSGSSIYLSFRNGLGIGGSSTSLQVQENLHYQGQSLTVKTKDQLGFLEISYSFSIQPKAPFYLRGLMLFVGAASGKGDFKTEIEVKDVNYNIAISEQSEPEAERGVTGGIVFIFKTAAQDPNHPLEILIGYRSENIIYKFEKEDYSLNRHRAMATLGLGYFF